MKWPVAIVAALALIVVSVACAVSCVAVQTAMPACHHHKGSASCAPLLLTGELPQVALAVAAYIAVLPIPVAEATASEFASPAAPISELPPPLTQHSVLRI